MSTYKPHKPTFAFDTDEVDVNPIEPTEGVAPTTDIEKPDEDLLERIKMERSLREMTLGDPIGRIRDDLRKRGINPVSTEYVRDATEKSIKAREFFETAGKTMSNEGYIDLTQPVTNIANFDKRVDQYISSGLAEEVKDASGRRVGIKMINNSDISPMIDSAYGNIKVPEAMSDVAQSDYFSELTRNVISQLPVNDKGEIEYHGVPYHWSELYEAFYPVVAERAHEALINSNKDYYNWAFEQSMGMSYEDWYKGYADKRVSEIEKKIIELRDAVAEETAQIAEGKGREVALSSGTLVPAALLGWASKEGARVEASKQFNDVLESINTFRNNDFISGLNEGFDWADALTLGMVDLGTSYSQLQLLEKAKRGETLSNSESKVLELLQLTQEFEGIKKSLGWERNLRSSVGSGLGSTLAMAAGFPLGMAGTSRIGTTVKLAANIAKNASKKAAIKQVGKNLIHNLGTAYMRGGAVSAFMPSTYTTGLKELQEQYSFNPDGTLKFAPKSKALAFMGGYIDTMNEYASEVFGSTLGEIIGYGARAFGRVTRLNKVVDAVMDPVNTGLGKAIDKGLSYLPIEDEAKLAGVRKALRGMIVPNAELDDETKELMRMWGVQDGYVAEATSEVFGDLMSQVMRDVVGAKTDYSDFKDSTYWGTQLLVAVLYGGSMNTLAHIKEGVSDYQQLVDLGKYKKDILDKIESRELRNRVLAITAEGSIEDMAKQLAEIEWEKYHAIDRAKVMDYIRAEMQIQVTAGSVEENSRVEDFVKEAARLSGVTYQGKGNMIIEVVADGRTYYLVDGNEADKSESSMLTCIDKETGEMKAIHSSKATTISAKYFNEVIQDVYTSRFSVSSEATRISALQSAYGQLERPTAEVARDMMKQMGITPPSEGEVITMSDGRKAKVEQDLENGSYVVRLQGEVPLLFTIPFYSIQSSNPLTAEAQKSIIEGKVGSATNKAADVSAIEVENGDITEETIAQPTQDVTTTETAEVDTQSAEAVAHTEEQIANDTLDMSNIPTDAEGNIDFDAIDDTVQYAALYEREAGSKAEAAKEVEDLKRNTLEAAAKLEEQAKNEITASAKRKKLKEAKKLRERAAFYDQVLPEFEEMEEEYTSVVKNEYSQQVAEPTLRVLDAMAKKLGLKVRFVERVNGGKANAQIRQDGYVDIAFMERNKSIAFLMGHEFTHRMQELSTKQYAEFKQMVKDFVGEDVWNALVAQTAQAYAKQNVPFTAELIEDEVTADAAGELVESNDAFRKYLEGKKEDKTFLMKVAEFLKDMAAIFNASNDSEREKQYLGLLDGVNKLIESAASAEASAAEMATKEAEGSESTERLREQGAIVDAERGDVRYSIADVLTGDQREQAIADLMRVTGRSRRTVLNYLKAEESLANIILSGDNKAFLDIQVDESVPSIWSNSDYPQGTVEFSNICRKRLPFTMIYQRLQKDFPNTVFDASSLESIRQTLIANGEEVACGLCFVEDRRQLLGEIGESFIKALKGEAVELNEKQQEAIARMRESGDTYIPNLYELITLDGMKILRKEHREIANAFVAYNNARGMQAGRLFQAYSAYHRDILNYDAKKVAKINNAGGLRIFSFSDFEAHHLIDLVQVLTDCAAKGIKVQGYTKVPQFAKAVKDTKMKVNRSLIAKAKGVVDADYIPQEGEAVSPNVVNGKRLLFDTVEGIDVTNPNFFDSTDSKNVGNILVGISDEHIRIAMLDPFVDYIIGFHTGLSEAIREQKGIAGWTNYKYTQLEKVLKDGKLVNADKHGINIYTEVLTPEIKTERQFVRKYLKVCEEKGWIPKYHRFLNKSKSGKFIYTKGYYKLLLDFKMFDANGRILPQEVVVPVFDNEVNARILEEYVEGEKAKAPNDELYEKVVDAMVERGVLTEAQVGEAMSQPKYSLITPEMDATYLDAVERGDMATAQRMVMEAAKLAMPNTKVVDEDGNPKVVYHGTGSEFYTFRKTSDINELGAGYYFSDSYEMAERYATDETLADNRFRVEALAFDIFTDEMGHSEEDYEDIEFEDDYNKAYDLAVERLFGNGHVKSVFLNIEKPRILSRESSDFDPVYQYGFNLHKEVAMAQRYNDGIIDELFSERYEGLTGNQYVTFASNQIKSADPVTYDDNGNIIPLSERFNPAKEDIRYSLMQPTDEEVTFDNFFQNTSAVFEVMPKSEVPQREPDYVSERWDGFGVSSRYWYGEDERGKYVIRESDHWSGYPQGERTREAFEVEPYNKRYTRIASSRWALAVSKEQVTTDKEVYLDGNKMYGKAYLADFTKWAEKNDARFSIIGEIGAANLDTYGRYGSPMLALELAREFEAEGKSAKDIRLATNWERGTDGKWRYEILDGVYNHPTDDDITAKEYRLADILDNPDLYKAYPYLKDIKVEYKPTMKSRGTYYNGVIELNASRTPEQINSTLLHEVQHAIQHIEMFARGGNADMFKDQEAINQLMREIEALGEDFRNTSNANIIRKAYLIYQLVKRGLNKDSINSKAFKAYRRLAGEVESRNVQKRMGMTEAQRLETLLSATEDVARKDQEMLFDEYEESAADARYSIIHDMTEEDAYQASLLEEAMRMEREATSNGMDVAQEIADVTGWVHLADGTWKYYGEGKLDITDKASAERAAFRWLESKKAVKVEQVRRTYAPLIKSAENNEVKAQLEYERDTALSQIEAEYKEIFEDFDNNPDVYVREHQEAESYNANLDMYVGSLTKARKEVERLERNAKKRKLSDEEKMAAMRAVKSAVAKELRDGLGRFTRKYDIQRMMDAVSDARTPYAMLKAIDKAMESLFEIKWHREYARMQMLTKSKISYGVTAIDASSFLNTFVSDHKITAADARKIMNDYWRGTKANGVSVAKYIDDTTRQAMEFISEMVDYAEARARFSDIEATEIIAFTRKLREKLEGYTSLNDYKLKTALANDAVRKAIIDAVDILEMYWKAQELQLSLNDDKHRRDISALEIKAKEITAQLREVNQQIKDLADGKVVVTPSGVKDRDLLRKELQERYNTLLAEREEAYAEMYNAMPDIINLMQDANRAVETLLRTGKVNLAAERAKRKEHEKELINDVLADLASPASPQKHQIDLRDKSIFERIVTGIGSLIGAPLGSMDYMLRAIGRNAPLGEGRTYKRFAYAFQKAYDNIYTALEARKKMLDDKCNILWGENYHEVHKMAESTKVMTLTYQSAINTKDGGWKPVENATDIYVTQAMYILAMWNQAEGRVTLERQGFTDESINAMRDALNRIDPRWIEFADWVVEEYLPSGRERYNAVHRDIFGTSMVAVPNYFPIKRAKEKLQKEEDVAKGDVDLLPSTVVGAIKERTSNVVPIDLETSFFEALKENTSVMEAWAEMAGLIQDINTILSNGAVKTTMLDINSTLFSDFKKAAQVATLSYIGKTPDIDKKLGTILNRLWAGSKIAFRLNTAFKQLSSALLFAGYSTDPKFQATLLWRYLGGVGKMPVALMNSIIEGASHLTGHSLTNIDIMTNIEWAKANMPSFAKRWNEGVAGNELMARTTSGNTSWKQRAWYVKFDDAVRAVTKFGMKPNAFIDAFTSAAGARAVYDYTYEEMRKEGYSEEEAHTLAIINAEMAFNTTQQSSEGLYLAPMQMDRSVVATTLSTFMNAPYAMFRNTMIGLKEIFRDAKKELAEIERLEFKRAMDVVKKQVETQVAAAVARGEYSEEEAKKRRDELFDSAKAKIIPLVKDKAYNKYVKAQTKAVVMVFLNGYAGQVAFNLMGKLAEFMFGDDDEEKKKMFYDIAVKSAWEAPVSMMPLGGYVTSMINGYSASFFPAMDELSKEISTIVKGLREEDISPEVIYAATTMCMRWGLGLSVDTIVNIALGIENMFEDGMSAEAILKVMNAPEGQIRNIVGQRKEGETAKEYSERVMRFYSILDTPIYEDYFYTHGEKAGKRKNEDSPRGMFEKQMRKLKYEEAYKRDVVLRYGGGEQLAEIEETRKAYNKLKTDGYGNMHEGKREVLGDITKVINEGEFALMRTVDKNEESYYSILLQVKNLQERYIELYEQFK